MANDVERSADTPRGRRAAANRRTRELPIAQSERRIGERRSGGDRRSSPRT